MRGSIGTIALLLTLCCLKGTAAEGQRRRLPAAPAAGSVATPVGYPGRADQVRLAAPARGGGVQTLTNQAKLSLAQAALATGRIRISGVGTGLRLSANQPYVADRAYLRVNWSTAFWPSPQGGQILLAGEADPSMNDMRSVNVRFQAPLANQPHLIDFYLRVIGPPQFPQKFKISGAGVVNHLLQIPPGDHHVTAVVVPSTPGWYDLHLIWFAPNSANSQIFIDYVEITPLH